MRYIRFNMFPSFNASTRCDLVRLGDEHGTSHQVRRRIPIKTRGVLQTLRVCVPLKQPADPAEIARPTRAR